MAELSVSYILCRLIDQKSLLGVSEHSEIDHVIVTLGKNIVVRYKVQDQKQISSWSSTLKFTAPVIYDGMLEKYVSVLDQNLLRLWDTSNETLDEVKKFKFGKKIHCLLQQTMEEPTLVVFCDGSFLPLPEALINRKADDNSKNLTIRDCKIVSNHGEKHIIYLSMTETETFFHAVSISRGTETKFLLSRDSLVLRGHAVLEDDGNCILYTQWSDSKLFAMRLFHDEHSPPGKAIHTMKNISCKHTVAMAPLSGSHLAFYGADVSEEGAVLFIFNTHFCVIQARRPSKLFGSEPRLWRIGTKLFLASGDFLTVFPYRLDVAKVAAIVGSHGPVTDKIERAVWGEVMNFVPEIDAPPSLARQLKSFSNWGWPQSTIVAQLIPILLKDKDYTAIMWLIENYYDVTEASIVNLLDYCLSQDDSEFEKLETEMEVENAAKETYESRGKRKFLDVILGCPFGDVALMPHLRSLSFSNTLALLAHLSERLATSAEMKYAEWMNLLLDSHYQEYLLSKDPLVLTTLTAVRNLVDAEIQDANYLKELAPLMQQLSMNKSIEKMESHGRYSIDDVTFDW